MSGRDALARAGASLVGITRPRRVHPYVTIELGAAIPAWVLRAALGLVALACVVLAIPAPGHALVAVPVVVAMVVWPGGLAPMAFAAGVGLLQLIAPDPLGWRLFALVFMSHLTLELAARAGTVSATALVELRVLADAGPRFLAIQAISQALALVAVWVSAGRSTDSAVPVVVGIVLAGAGWLLLSRLVDER